MLFTAYLTGLELFVIHAVCRWCLGSAAIIVTLIFIIIIFTIIELPALVVLGLWFLLQLLPAFSQPVVEGGGGVAYFAHIGGFIFGLVVIKAFANRIHEDYDSQRRIPVY